MIDEIIEMAKEKVILFDNKLNNFLSAQADGDAADSL
jgi:hypothetical protein